MRLRYLRTAPKRRPKASQLLWLASFSSLRVSAARPQKRSRKATGDAYYRRVKTGTYGAGLVFSHSEAAAV